MCGIIGAIGNPTDVLKSYSLMTHLLRETQRRGPHATGFYGIDLDNEIITHKAPGPACNYVKTLAWKQCALGFQALLGHDRFATHGLASNNINNHPFLDCDNNVGLVHNGVVYFYDENKADYTLESECDSELILKIITKEPDILSGIKKVYELLGAAGDFACELIHRDTVNGKNTFYFFRDTGRPGKMIDARLELGQIFFCSETAIWKDAVRKAGLTGKLKKLDVVDVDPFVIIAVDANTLEIVKTKVERPVRVSRATSYTYYPGNTGAYHNQCGANRFKNDNYDDDDTYYNRPKHHETKTVARTSGTAITSVLDECWTETVNDRGLPHFIYDPNKKKKIGFTKPAGKSDNTAFSGNVDETTRSLLQRCIDIPSERYPGWHDDAYDANLITTEEWTAYSNASESKDDALNHVDNSDGDFLENLENQLFPDVPPKD